MPAWLRRPLLRRSRRRYLRLRALASRATGSQKLMAQEALKSYPEDLDLLLPTRLGNALRAMEDYGESRYGLDSQTFWYELQAVGNEKVVRSTEETRASVDFFVSSLAHLTFLSLAAVACVPFVSDPAPVAILSALALALTPLAYIQAVSGVGEWRWSVQALVNTSRSQLAAAVGLTLPETHGEERRMWVSLSGLVHSGPRDRYLAVLDAARAKAPTTHSRPDGSDERSASGSASSAASGSSSSAPGD